MSGKIGRRSFIFGLAGATLAAHRSFGIAGAKSTSGSAAPIAETQYGKVRGVGGKVLSFRGVSVWRFDGRIVSVPSTLGADSVDRRARRFPSGSKVHSGR